MTGSFLKGVADDLENFGGMPQNSPADLFLHTDVFFVLETLETW